VGVSSSAIYLIHCDNLCKCHSVPPPSTTIKKEKEKHRHRWLHWSSLPRKGEIMHSDEIAQHQKHAEPRGGEQAAGRPVASAGLCLWLRQNQHEEGTWRPRTCALRTSASLAHVPGCRTF
jgi:hypothetical protein